MKYIPEYLENDISDFEKKNWPLKISLKNNLCKQKDKNNYLKHPVGRDWNILAVSPTEE